MSIHARFMLDTDTCIYYQRRRSAAVRKRFEALTPGEALISVVTWGELMFGAAKSRMRDAVLENLENFSREIVIAPMTPECALCYAETRADLERRGVPIGGNDLWIAAHALSLGLTLVTNNEEEFTRVKGLKVENWI